MAARRSVFEEVGGPKAASGPQGGMIAKQKPKGRNPVRRWLAVLWLLVAAMILVGGMTRLTDSGLSITEWNLVTGAVPPLNEADWQAEFAKYRETPEFQTQNRLMEIGQFKSIYWWEWGHRQLGRTIGLVWAVGFVWFLARNRVPPGWAPRLVGLGALIGVTGGVGWWMVRSGLGPGMVDVASYRLAIHAGLAFTILGLLSWYVLSLARPAAEMLQVRRQGDAGLFSAATGLMHLCFLQILLGALVAGIDAGRAFPTWPLMGESFFPADAFYLPGGGAVWRAFFENAGLVQFVHRIGAYLVAILGLIVWLKGRRSVHPGTVAAFHLVGLTILVQAALGIVTVLHAAPLPLAIAHQAGAIVLWTLILRARHRALYPIPATIRGAR
ncbi:MAG: heme A synthase [Paracoccaceae bacterium]